MKRKVSWMFGLGIILLLISGCGASYMQPVPTDVMVTPSSDKAMITFMRASRGAGGVKAALFHAGEETNYFIGTVGIGQKIAYLVEPGEHIFMVNVGKADFMRGTLDAGKSYYALVYPRWGAFGIKPVHKEVLSTDKFQSWQNGTVYIEKKPEADNWDQDNAVRIQKQKLDKLDGWLTGPGRTEDRALQPDDGI